MSGTNKINPMAYLSLFAALALLVPLTGKDEFLAFLGWLGFLGWHRIPYDERLRRNLDRAARLLFWFAVIWSYLGFAATLYFMPGGAGVAGGRVTVHIGYLIYLLALGPVLSALFPLIVIYLDKRGD